MTTKLATRKKESYKIFDEIAPSYDFLNHFLSLGIDIYWRQKFLAALPKTDKIVVLDLATGTGDVPLVLVKDKRVKKVTGIDRSKGMVDIGKKKIQKKKLEKKIELKLGDGVKIPFADETFNVVTISFGIRNFSDHKESLKNIYRVLSPKGKVLIMEFSLPKNSVMRFLYFFYFRNILPRIGNLFSGHGDAYTYLNKTVEDFPYGAEFAGHLKEAGLKNVSYKSYTFGIATLYQGEK
ncbi:MAG: bifunctional demethylmenaquinone methyltransferase/2-methoxy-6-polyprenyl-1,4-benzoquinol methylase UbiE [Epsilonproteobacteria bacterium]|nr:MAG: bifunctional demethylmenaquinone methyltransferase/2-methoxy-6-polyprenyl-1,4-benzoquinol methylase UbiE [Campylobacterota bacterium]RLA65753.1 MAG: bifunctional demethylmenaquinone methyltransferase/2-methoxy-6-polyprenyl-1,4-benzoquinol methylase UbiE [Campylobacterota bacterium]